MKNLVQEIYNTFRDYKADIFFIAAVTMVTVILIDVYKVDLFNNKGKRHINVITVEGYDNKKKTAPQKKVLTSRKVKLPMMDGFISNKMIVNSTPVVREGMSEPPAGTPAAEIYKNTKNGPKALEFGKDLRSTSNNVNSRWKKAFCRKDNIDELNEECLKLSSIDNPAHCNNTDCCVSVHFSDKSKVRCLAGDKVGPIQTTYIEKTGEGKYQEDIEFVFNRDKDYYYHKNKCYGTSCPN